VVLFRLIFPFSIESVFSLMPNVQYSTPQSVAYSPRSAVQTGVQSADTTLTVGIINDLQPAVSEYGASPTHSVLEIAGYIWLVGFAALLLYAGIGYLLLKRKVYFATLVRDNIFESDTIKSPFVLGLFRPKISAQPPSTLSITIMS